MNNINKRFHFMTPMREVYTIALYTGDIFDSINGGGKLFSKLSVAWTILNDKFVPEQFLDISPFDHVIGIFRGRWVLVKHPLETFNVSGNNEIVAQHKMYVYDTYSSRVYECVQMPEGRYIPSVGGARDLVTGEIFNSSLLDNFEMIDIEPLTADQSATDRNQTVSHGTPILSMSPPNIANNAAEKFVYILKSRSKIKDYSVYIGPQWGKGVKLSSVRTVSNYWHVAWPWIAYNQQVDNLLDAKKNFKIEATKIASGITLYLADVYFVSVNTLVTVYESQNYQAIVSVNL